MHMHKGTDVAYRADFWVGDLGIITFLFLIYIKCINNNGLVV